MKDGLLPVVAAAGGVAVVLVWSMSVNDPYWRLFETPSVPAPAYEQPEDLIAVLATVTREFSNNDAGATSPAADPLAGAGRSDIRPDIPLDITLSAAEAAAIPEPMVALVPPLEPEPMTGPATDAMIAYRPPVAALPVPMIALAPPLEPEPMTGPAIDSTIAYQLPGPAIPVPAGLETEAEIVIAFAPQPLPAPAALRDRGAGAGSETLSGPALDPFVAPAPPAQPRVAASELTEEALALGPHARIDVQRRLALAGFDPSGFDGAFGPRTRRAIADFQTAWGFPATGYLEEAVYAELNQRTEDAYQALRRQAAAAPSAAPELAPIARERQLASAEDDGRCARRSDGRIIERQSLRCDLAGFTEQFVSLGRNTLNDEDDAEIERTVEAGSTVGNDSAIEDGGAVADDASVEIAVYAPPVRPAGADR